MKKTIFYNVDLCVSCNSCELGCAIQHSESKTLVGSINETPKPFSRIRITKNNNGPNALYCRHCDNAACMDACPPKAIERIGEDGVPVHLQEEKCDGSQACIKACHFKVIVAGEDGKTLARCDLCTDRQEAGLAPACVEYCPTGALLLLTDEEIKSRIEYKVDEEACTKCGVCFKRCPYDAITWKKKELAVIDESKCERCGVCDIVCKFKSINRIHKVEEKV